MRFAPAELSDVNQFRNVRAGHVVFLKSVRSPCMPYTAQSRQLSPLLESPEEQAPLLVVLAKPVSELNQVFEQFQLL